MTRNSLTRWSQSRTDEDDAIRCLSSLVVEVRICDLELILRTCTAHQHDTSVLTGMVEQVSPHHVTVTSKLRRYRVLVPLHNLVIVV